MQDFAVDSNSADEPGMFVGRRYMLSSGVIGLLVAGVVGAVLRLGRPATNSLIARRALGAVVDDLCDYEVAKRRLNNAPERTSGSPQAEAFRLVTPLVPYEDSLCVRSCPTDRQ